MAAPELEAVRQLGRLELSDILCRSKLAEILEKILKAELLMHGWVLVRTHDLRFLAKELRDRQSVIFVDAQPLAAEFAEAYMLDRYPGFDLDDADWPTLRTRMEQVAELLAKVQTHLTAPLS